MAISFQFLEDQHLVALTRGGSVHFASYLKGETDSKRQEIGCTHIPTWLEAVHLQLVVENSEPTLLAVKKRWETRTGVMFAAEDKPGKIFPVSSRISSPTPPQRLAVALPFLPLASLGIALSAYQRWYIYP